MAATKSKKSTHQKKASDYPNANLTATEHPEVQAAVDGYLPHTPYSPQVAVPNDHLSEPVRKKVTKAAELVREAEEEAFDQYNQEAIVTLRTARRSLEAI